MELLLILTYAAIAIAVFKLFNIPLNKWTVPTAILGGIVILSTLIFVMNYNHPHAEIARSYFATTPIVPQVKGIVTEVSVQNHQNLKKGDVLFRIDPTRYKNRVGSLKAQLVAAKKRYKRTVALLKGNAGSVQDVDNARAQRDSLKEKLDNALFDLANTTIYAPTSGYVTQLILRPGVMAVPLPMKPVMIFVHLEESIYTAWFRQNSLLRLKAGEEAEVALDGIPGQVFKAKVDYVATAMAEGQLQPSGNMIKVYPMNFPGRVPVTLKITDPLFEQYRDKIPTGAFGQAAIYTHHYHHLAIMRKVLLRMASWMNYIYPFH